MGRLKTLTAVLSLSLALSGCGGAVSVNSNFSGASAPPPTSLPTGGARPGLTASGSGSLALVIVASLIIADVVHWTTSGLKQAFSRTAEIAKECE